MVEGTTHTSFLASLSVGVLFAAKNYCVDCNQDCEEASENRLHGNEDYTGNRLGSLRDPKLFYEDENADNSLVIISHWLIQGVNLKNTYIKLERLG